MNSYEYSSNSGTKTFIVIGIVALSVILFFAFTLPIFKNRPSEVSSPAGNRSDPPPVESSTPATPVAAAPTSPPVTPTAPATAKSYLKPQNLLSDLAANLAQGNHDAAFAILDAGDLDADASGNFRRLIVDGRFLPVATEPFSEIGRFNSDVRYALNLQRPASDGLEAARSRILLDLTRGASASSGWHVSGLQIPTFTALNTAAAAAPGGTPAPVTTVEGDTIGANDPLMLAHEFVEAILGQDFERAKSLIDTSKITEEKLAGLFIVAEEGGFQRRTESPLVATAAQNDAAWVIAQLINPETGADFGLELSRSPEAGGAWTISGLNLDSLLLARAKMADIDDVTYTPIIQNPKGGDSLVLFFGYDEGILHPRAQRQLEIVARILKGDANKTILINGHADAMGSDDYNSQLSDQRAASVRKGLLAAGVSPSQIKTSALGESQPISPNVLPDGTDNPTGRKRNRRAEVYLPFGPCHGAAGGA